MRLTPISTILVLFDLSLVSSALPLQERELPRALERRRPYSVVAVDGGIRDTSSLSTTTPVETVVRSNSTLKTTTTTSTRFESIVTTSTSLVTLTVLSTTAVVVTTQSISILSRQTSTSTVLASSRQHITGASSVNTASGAPSTPTASASLASAYIPYTSSTTTSTYLHPKSSSSSFSPSITAPYLVVHASIAAESTTTTFYNSSAPIHRGSGAMPMPTVRTVPPSSTTSYDDGQWHTTYPRLNATLVARSTSAPMPTLVSASIDPNIPDNAIPGMALPNHTSTTTTISTTSTKPTPSVPSATSSITTNPEMPAMAQPNRLGTSRAKKISKTGEVYNNDVIMIKNGKKPKPA